MTRGWSPFILAGLLSLAVLHPRASAQPYGSLMDLIVSSPNLNNLEILVNATGLDVLLSNTNLTATAFLPTDTAISNFVVNVLGLSGGVAALNVSDPLIKSGLTKLLQYHLIFGGYSLARLATGVALLGNTRTTFLSNAVLGRTTTTTYSKLLINATNSTSEPPQLIITLLDTTGQSVQVNSTFSDIPIDNGTSYAHMIDSVLIYWYPTMWQALTANNLTSLQSALTVASAAPGNTNWPEIFASPNASYTLFGLTNTGFDRAFTTYGINLTDASTPSIDILNYHISSYVQTIDPPYISPLTITYSTMSKQTLLFQINSTATNTNVWLTDFNNFTWYIWIAQIPVGGLVPNAYLAMIDRVMIPVYSDVLTALKGSGAQYNLFATLVQGNSISDGVVPLMKSTLSDAKSSVTVLSPNQAGWKAFMDKYGIVDIAKYYFPDLNRLLATHVLTVSSNSSQIQIPNMYDTFIPGQKISSGNFNGSFTNIGFGTGLTNAMMGTPSYNVSVFYGRSYLYVVDYVLVPRTLGLPQSGAAFLVSPSFMMMLLLQGCALVAAQMMAATLAL